MSVVNADYASSHHHTNPTPSVWQSAPYIHDEDDDEERSSENSAHCPLCMEELDATDRAFYPCACHYQICLYCFQNIMDRLGGKCPACRSVYDANAIRSAQSAVDRSAITAAESARRSRRARDKQTVRSMSSFPAHPSNSSDKNHSILSNHPLASVRVVQRNLVYVIGIPGSIAQEEILRKRDYFGRFGKIIKAAVAKRQILSTSIYYGDSTNSSQDSTSNPTSSLVSSSPSNSKAVPTFSAYITYKLSSSAAEAIKTMHNSVLHGCVVRCTYGTTKYCSHFMRGERCPNPNCLYLHELAREEDCVAAEEEIHRAAEMVKSTTLEKTDRSSTVPAAQPDKDDRILNEDYIDKYSEYKEHEQDILNSSSSTEEKALHASASLVSEKKSADNAPSFTSTADSPALSSTSIASSPSRSAGSRTPVLQLNSQQPISIFAFPLPPTPLTLLSSNSTSQSSTFNNISLDPTVAEAHGHSIKSSSSPSSSTTISQESAASSASGPSWSSLAAAATSTTRPPVVTSVPPPVWPALPTNASAASLLAASTEREKKEKLNDKEKLTEQSLPVSHHFEAEPRVSVNEGLEHSSFSSILISESPIDFHHLDVPSTSPLMDSVVKNTVDFVDDDAVDAITSSLAFEPEIDVNSILPLSPVPLPLSESPLLSQLSSVSALSTSTLANPASAPLGQRQPIGPPPGFHNVIPHHASPMKPLSSSFLHHDSDHQQSFSHHSAEHSSFSLFGNGPMPPNNDRDQSMYMMNPFPSAISSRPPPSAPQHSSHLMSPPPGLGYNNYSLPPSFMHQNPPPRMSVPSNTSNSHMRTGPPAPANHNSSISPPTSTSSPFQSLSGFSGFQQWDFSRFVQDLQTTSQGNFLPMPNAPRLEMAQLQQQQQQLPSSLPHHVHPHNSGGSHPQIHQSHQHHPNPNPPLNSSSLFQNFPSAFPLPNDYDQDNHTLDNSFWRNRNL